MQNDIFSLLMMILMLENGGGTESINQLVIMFLLMNSQNSDGNGNTAFSSSRHRDRCNGNCCREDGFTF